MSDDADDGMFWSVLRQRDDYRSRVTAAVERIERETGQVTNADGNVTALVLPIDAWRSIRAMLQREVTA